MISFTKAPNETPTHVAKVKAWVEEFVATTTTDLNNLPTVMVSQIQCSKVGCAPVETSISLLLPNNNKTGKILKPIQDVTKEETIAFLKNLIAVE